MTRQYIYIGPQALQAVISVDSDIDKLEILNYSLDESMTLLQNFEEFVYRNPSLLRQNVPTSVLIDSFPAVLLPSILDDTERASLLNEAWSENDTHGNKWLYNKTGFPDENIIAFNVEDGLYNFISRSFHPVEIKSLVEVYTSKWHGNITMGVNSGRIAFHVDTDDKHIFLGVTEGTDKLLSAAVYTKKPEYSYILYFLYETIKLYNPDKANVRICLSDRLPEIDEFKKILSANYNEVVISRVEHRVAYNAYVYGLKEILPSLSLFISRYENL